jgi:DNA-binding NtrC family response regulator
VHTASSGEAALEVLGTSDVDVVVLDIKMPGMNGLEVLRRIRRKHPDVRVLLLSGHPTAEDAVHGMKLGAMDYLMKPPDVVRLVELVQRGSGERREELASRRERLVRDVLERQPE